MRLRLSLMMLPLVGAVAHGHIPWALVAHPVFLAGLLLKVPFAVAAYAAARLLLDAVVVIVDRRSPTVSGRKPPRVSASSGSTVPPSRLLLSARRLTRGPPRALAA